MSAITCAEGSATCKTISNILLPTDVPAHHYTGLSAVNVNEAEDWRVFYHDNQGFISQLQGNASGFNAGERIGGQGLNATSIATVNINSTTNNIQLFYVDISSQNLYTMQFVGAWTTRKCSVAIPYGYRLIFHSTTCIFLRFQCLESFIRSWCRIQRSYRPAPCILHRSRSKNLWVHRLECVANYGLRLVRSAYEPTPLDGCRLCWCWYNGSRMERPSQVLSGCRRQDRPGSIK